MLDEVIVTQTPPLYSCYGRNGQPVQVPITGQRSKRILHGALNIKSGEVALLISPAWTQYTHQIFLRLIRAHWRGWQIVLFEDRGSPHTAEGSLRLAADLNMEIRFLPRATPELNAMDHLWRWVKGRGLANHPTTSIDESADRACQYIWQLRPKERLQKAGVNNRQRGAGDCLGCVRFVRIQPYRIGKEVNRLQLLSDHLVYM